MSEVEEMIAALPDAAFWEVQSKADAREAVEGQFGEPAEIGFQIFNNLVEAFWARAKREGRVN